MFRTVDVNDDALIPINEFIAELKANGLSIDETELEYVKENIDSNKDGYVNFSEFLSLAVTQNK